MAPDKYRLPNCVRAGDVRTLRRLMLFVQLKEAEQYVWQITYAEGEWVAWYPAPLSLETDPNLEPTS